MRFYPIFLFALAGLFLISCQKDNPSATAADDFQQYINEAEQRLAEADALAEEELYVSERAPGVLSAGSVNGLSEAIAEVGPYGTVIVESGLHIETGMVTITYPVRIIGETGAVIQSTTTPSTDLPYIASPSIYIDHAKQVQVEGLTFVPDPAIGQGGTGILISYSDHALIRDNEFSEYLQAVVVHKSNQVRLYYNRAKGLLSEGYNSFTSFGFIVASGKSAYLRGNVAEDYWGNYFVSGQNGILYRNTATAGETGFVLCTFPGLTGLPSGEEFIAAEVSATGWLTVDNRAVDGVRGYLVIDGTNNCRLVANHSANNSLYDYEVVGPSERFGPPALPTTFDNVLLIQGNEAIVKDCGVNTTISGGKLVDNDLDPCF
ncbi:MAG: hypothetical protein H6564_22230 [Lewinellaceae bacterium]|nr:hypothetical protein [Lewinellaceae bacterium]